MRLSSRHRIRHLRPGGLRPSTLLLGHGGSSQYSISTSERGKTICFFRAAETGKRTPSSGVKSSGANHYPRAPAPFDNIQDVLESLKHSRCVCMVWTK